MTSDLQVGRQVGQAPSDFTKQAYVVKYLIKVGRQVKNAPKAFDVICECSLTQVNRNADFICTVVLGLTEIRKAKKSFVESWHVIDGLFSPDNATTHKVLQMILMIPCQLLPEQGRRNYKSHSLMQGPVLG